MGLNLEARLQLVQGQTLESDSGEVRIVSDIALLGRDYPGINFEMLCKVGDRVKAGSEVMRDARRPAVVFTAPVAGRVIKIERGARRKLKSLQIEIDATIGVSRKAPPQVEDKSSLRAFMQETGIWTALRTRPFGNIPDPANEPAALFVTAIDSEPLAPDPAPIIDEYKAEFEAGVNVLLGITETPVYICHAKGVAAPLTGSARLHNVAFGGTLSSGLPGVHINALCAIGFAGGEVWHIGYQEVIALGHLMLTGTPWMERVVTISGPAVTRPRYLRVAPGASVQQLLDAELHEEAVQIYSGSVLRGRIAEGSEAYLGAGHRQISLLFANTVVKYSSRFETSQSLIPSDDLESLAPPGIYAVPMMRALQVGDIDRARELGALELVEEDLALLSHACQSQSDYGQMLRNVLQQLEETR